MLLDVLVANCSDKAVITFSLPNGELVRDCRTIAADFPHYCAENALGGADCCYSCRGVGEQTDHDTHVRDAFMTHTCVTHSCYFRCRVIWFQSILPLVWIPLWLMKNSNTYFVLKYRVPFRHFINTNHRQNACSLTRGGALVKKILTLMTQYVLSTCNVVHWFLSLFLCVSIQYMYD